MPTLTLDGDASGAVKATGQVTDQVARLKAEFKAAATEAAQLTREAKRIVDENATPQEQYNAKMEQLSKLYVAGKLNVEQMDRAVANYGKQLGEATKAHDKHKEAHEEAFGAESLKELVNYAAGLITVEKGIEFVTDALREQAEEKRKAAEGVGSGLSGIDAIVNSGNPKRAMEIAQDFMDGLINRDTGQNIAFGVGGNIVTSGHENEAKFLKDLAEKRYIQAPQAGELAQNISKIEHGFGPGAGGFEDIFKKLRVAVNKSGVGVSPADLARYLADLSDKALENNIPFDQAIAVLTTEAQKSKTLKSGEAAAKDYITKGNVYEGSRGADYQENLSSIQTARGQTLPDIFKDLDPRYSSARLAETSKANAKTTTENMFAEKQSLMDAMRSDFENYEKQHGFPAWQRLLIRTLSNTTQTIFSDEDLQMRRALEGPGQRRELSPETIERMEKHLGIQTEIMQRNSRSLPLARGLQE